MLTEVYGLTDPERAAKIYPAIHKSLNLARAIQTKKKYYPTEKGGWRYFTGSLEATEGLSDLSSSAWYLMFYRSAKNAEFDVPKVYADEAVEYVRSCYVPEERMFRYTHFSHYASRRSRGLNGCGILSLAMAGRHESPIAGAAADWIVEHPFDRYGETFGLRDRFFYSAYYCSQAMFQMGGDRWNRFYPPLVKTLLGNQQPNGSWPPEPTCGDRVFGDNITTTMAVLALTPPYQLLPIYQR